MRAAILPGLASDYAAMLSVGTFLSDFFYLVQLFRL